MFGTVDEIRYLAGPLEHVRERQEGDEDVGGAEALAADVQYAGRHYGHHVKVGEHDALGVTRCAACVAYGAQTVRLWRLKTRKKAEVSLAHR